MVHYKKCSILITFFFSVFILVQSIDVDYDTKDYIVYLGSISNKYSLSEEHINILQQVVEGRPVDEVTIRSYKRSFNGFAARLTTKEYEKLKSMKEVVSVFPSRRHRAQTTRSWDFIGLPEQTSKELIEQSDVIIGVIDSGIWPESLSFRDDGLSPVPKKWKGECHGGTNFTCNRKVIGARGYGEKGGSARDEMGHGTHTASIAAGRRVEGASFYDIVKGTARGGVPSSRIAVYNVFDQGFSTDTQILASFDDAIADGVDLITISIEELPSEFYNSSISIGAFHAMAKGILTVQCAGNGGSVTNALGGVAPWILSVAASTIDRRFISKIPLGDRNTLIGESVNSFKLKGMFPLVYGKDATSSCNESGAKACLTGCIDASRVKEKILVCNNESGYITASDVGVFAMLGATLPNYASVVVSLPAALLLDKEFAALESYLNSTKDPMANILKSEAIKDTTAPIVATFSSRGPNLITSDILKPDISAPGADILGAYPPESSVSGAEGDKRSVTYNLLTGTSMACPHVAGAAAIVKSVHPDWSPAAIKSALMTTANPMSPTKNPDAEFAYGSGNLNLSKVANPGLVYETTENDYVAFLCKIGYDEQKISIITGNNITCSKNGNMSPKDVNYPSMSALVVAEKAFTLKFSRTVMNVGKLNSVYNATITSSPEINVTVKPSYLFFETLKENKSFEVTIVGKELRHKSVISASLVWSDGIHSVRSPIVVYTK